MFHSGFSVVSCSVMLLFVRLFLNTSVFHCCYSQLSWEGGGGGGVVVHTFVGSKHDYY